MSGWWSARRTVLRWRLYLLGVAWLTLAALLGSGVYRALLAPPAEFPTPPRDIAHTDVNPYGANFFLAREVELWKRERTLRMAAEAGLGWVKQHFAWEEIEPLRKGEFLDPVRRTSSWEKYDEIVAAAEEHGLRIVARLDRPPDWTREDNTLKERPPDNLEDYGDFVYEFVRRYRGRIDHIQVWNEPNIYPEWGERPVDPAEYVELLKVAYRRAKEANPNVLVLSAPLAITLGEPHPEPGRWRSMNDLDFLEGMYQAGAAGHFDILSANAFGMDRPPEDPPDPHVLNMQRVVLQRQIMERYGDGHKAVWFNEYGWNAAPETFPESALIWRRVSEEEQAEFTVRGITMAREEWPWAGVFMIWYIRQVGNIPETRADYYFRMIDVDFTPRPVFLAVQDATRRQRVAAPGHYEEYSAPVARHGRWEQVLDPDASGGLYLRAEEPGAAVTLTFRGAGVDLLTRRGSQEGRLLVSLDGRSVPGLATDSEGRSYVDLYAPVLEAPARVPLVSGLGGGVHTLRLTVSAETHPQTTGQLCAVDAFVVLPTDARTTSPYALAALAVALGVCSWLLARTVRRGRWVLRSG